MSKRNRKKSKRNRNNYRNKKKRKKRRIYMDTLDIKILMINTKH